MSTMFKKNLHLCFFKIKCLPSSTSPPLTLETEDDEDDYFYLDTDNYQTTTTSSAASLSTSSATESSNPDFSTVFASQRFFVSSPGCSNSILDSCTTTTTNNNVDTKLVSGGVAVKKDSPDPFSDFRRSMLEMIESRERETSRLRVGNDDVDENSSKNYSNEWEYLHELLLCYLELNPKHMHKFIIEAFSDVLVSRVSPLSLCLKRQRNVLQNPIKRAEDMTNRRRYYMCP